MPNSTPAGGDPRTDTQEPGGARAWRVMVALGLLGIMAAAAFLRFFRLSTVTPGLHTDEAFYALDALRVLTDRIHPVFFEANSGREPFFIYLLALAMRVLGPSRTTARLVSALVGLGTVALMYPLVTETMPAERGRVRQAAGLFAALALGTLYWHVHYSHLALRAITMPLLEAIAMLLLWRAWRTGRSAWFALAGAALGLSLYTYLAARLLPPLIGLIVVLLALTDRSQVKRNWRGLALMAGLAAIVFLPLGLYFLQHPASFTGRMGEITMNNEAALAGSNQDIWSNTVRTLLMFTGAGDWGWLDNLAGRPVLDAVGVAGLALGLLAVCVRWRQVRYVQWIAWLAVMILPSAITNYAPTQTRSIGAVVPLAGLLGIGYAHAWSWLARRLPARAAAPLLALLLVVIGAFSGATTYRDYYLNWARRPEAASALDADYRLAGEAVTQLPANSEVFVSFVDEGAYQATLDFTVQEANHAAPSTEPRNYRMEWHNRDCLVLPAPAGRPVAFLLPGEGQSFLPALQAAYPGGAAGQGHGYGGKPLFRSYLVDPAAFSQGKPPAPAHPMTYHLGSATLLGWDLPAAGPVHPGAAIDLVLYWRADAPVDRSYTIFAQLTGEQKNASGNTVWGQRDGQPCSNTYPTTAWQPGSTVIVRHKLTVDPKAPAGEYRLVAGIYYLPTGERVVPRDEQGGTVPDNAVPLATVRVEP